MSVTLVVVEISIYFSFNANFFGLPPFLPFLRAAADFFSEVEEPPSLPRDTAAGFLGFI